MYVLSFPIIGRRWFCLSQGRKEQEREDTEFHGSNEILGANLKSRDACAVPVKEEGESSWPEVITRTGEEGKLRFY
jgi:hypothetical protein